MPKEENASEAETSSPLGEGVTEKIVPNGQFVADQLDADLYQNPEDNAEESSDNFSEDFSDNDADNFIAGILDESSEDGGSSDASESEESEENSESSDESSADESNKDGFKKGLEKVQNQRDEALEKAKTLEAENLALQAKFESFENKINQLLEQKDVTASQEAKTEKKEDVLSDKELATAIKTFMDEEDPQGIIDVINYKVDESKKALRKEYENQQKQQLNEVKKKQIEWTTISKEYSPEGYDNELIKDDADFDIRDNTSALYKSAEKIYLAGIQQGQQRYSIQGGMSNAVQDAFVRLLQSKFGQTKSGKKPQKDNKETEGLKQRLAKEHRKNALNSGASSSDEATKSAKKEKPVDELKDYLSERNKQKNERMGLSI